MVLTRVDEQRPPKPAAIDSDQPLQLIQIRGNVRKCFGCGLHLIDGPPKYSIDCFDATYCLRHKEHDHFFAEKYGKWMPKFENKHFHIARVCVSDFVRSYLNTKFEKIYGSQAVTITNMNKSDTYMTYMSYVLA